jgi:acyl carrier protein phosphodiesterase
MNFLAHCALAQDASDCWDNGNALRDGLLAGAILADFGKGPIASHLPLDLQAGIRLHRRIDAFTNQHDLIRDTLRLVSPRAAPLRADFPRHSRRLLLISDLG